MSPTWAVVTTTNEPADVLVAFAIHHLAIGAREIHFYLDQPDEIAHSRLVAITGCKVFACDDAHFQGLGKRRRPRNIEYRQVVNAQHAYDTAQVDWLLHLDGDEFVFSKYPLADELAHLPAGIHRLGLKNVERVYPAGSAPSQIFEGMFRIDRGVSVRSSRQLFGDLAAITTRGFSGHTSGKSLTRTGCGHLIGIHSPRASPKTGRGFIRALGSAGSMVLHFDGLTPLHWGSKLLRYLSQDQYIAPDFSAPNVSPNSIRCAIQKTILPRSRRCMAA